LFVNFYCLAHNNGEGKHLKMLKKLATKRVKTSPSRAPSSKTAPPSPKMGPAKKIGILKISRSKAKPRPQGTSEIELALVKSVGVSKKFHLLDVAVSSHGPHIAGTTATHTARVLAFHNLGDDSSPDVRKTPSPKNTVEKHASPLPLVSGEFLRFSFALLPWALITTFQILPSLLPRWICHWRIWTKT
jgi:hypothetical protein